MLSSFKAAVRRVRRVPARKLHVRAPLLSKYEAFKAQSAAIQVPVEDQASFAQPAGVFSNTAWKCHDSLHYFHDGPTGLRGIVAIHDTLLGPALGGCRFYNYKTEEDALFDVLRLSRGMTFKAAGAGLPLGGGKAVIIGNEIEDRDARGALFRRFGMFIESLGGTYITAEDVNTSTSDMVHVRAMTRHVTGIPTEMGGCGNPGPFTARGAFLGMKVAVKHRLEKDSLQGLTVLIEGLGNVGMKLAAMIHEDGGNLLVCDRRQSSVDYAVSTFGAKAIDQSDMFSVPCDIYSPNAMGGTVTAKAAHSMKASIIAGAANNQLDFDTTAQILKDRNILYVVDHIGNSGGLISVESSIHGGWSEARANSKVDKIADNIELIFQRAAEENITTVQAAQTVAVDRLRQRAYETGSQKSAW